MDLQKEREAFKAWFKKEYLGIDNLANQGDEGAITRRDYAYVGWQAAKSQVVPEGFVLVPRVATKQMVNAGYESHDGFFTNGQVQDVYQAMIEAQEQSHE